MLATSDASDDCEMWSLIRASSQAGSAINVFQCLGEARKVELESLVEQSPRHATSAREGQPSITAHQPGANPHGPRRRGRAPGPMQRPPKFAHKLRVRRGI